MRKILQIALSLFLILIGGLIYLAYRSNTLLMFEWFTDIGLITDVEALREYCSEFLLPNWIIYSFPDGLWLLSYMLLVDAIWGEGYGNQHLLWLLILPIIALISELMQLFISQLGTFDIMDLTCYVVAIVLFYIIKLLK